MTFPPLCNTYSTLPAMLTVVRHWSCVIISTRIETLGSNLPGRRQGPSWEYLLPFFHVFFCRQETTAKPCLILIPCLLSINPRPGQTAAAKASSTDIWGNSNAGGKQLYCPPCVYLSLSPLLPSGVYIRGRTKVAWHAITPCPNLSHPFPRNILGVKSLPHYNRGGTNTLFTTVSYAQITMVRTKKKIIDRKPKKYPSPSLPTHTHPLLAPPTPTPTPTPPSPNTIRAPTGTTSTSPRRAPSVRDNNGPVDTSSNHHRNTRAARVYSPSYPTLS